MARPRTDHPTPAELEVLHLLWEQGPMTVRQAMAKMDEKEHRAERAYTSVMSLMNVMADKGLLLRTPLGRAFLYEPAVEREPTLAGMVGDLLNRAFSGSASLLVTQLLDQANPSGEELAEIRKAIRQFERGKESD